VIKLLGTLLQANAFVLDNLEVKSTL